VPWNQKRLKLSALPSPPTVAALLEVMKAAGIQPKDDRKSGISDYVKR